MTAQEVVELINSVGFPIVMCGALMWYIHGMTNKFTDSINSLSEKFTVSIDKNQEILNRIESYLLKSKE